MMLYDDYENLFLFVAFSNDSDFDTGEIVIVIFSIYLLRRSKSILAPRLPLLPSSSPAACAAASSSFLCDLSAARVFFCVDGSSARERTTKLPPWDVAK